MSLFDIFSSSMERLVVSSTNESKETPDWAAFSEIWDLANRDAEAYDHHRLCAFLIKFVCLCDDD